MSSSILFIGNLPAGDSSVIRRALGEHFSRYGPILGLDLNDDHAVLRLSNNLAVNDAISFEQGADILGNYVVLSNEPFQSESAEFESADGHNWRPPNAKRHCTGLVSRPASQPTSADLHEEVRHRPNSEVELVSVNFCGLIVLDRCVTAYAEHVESRISGLGLKVDTVYLGPDSSVYHEMEEMVNRHVLYAFVIHPSNEPHRSVSLKILCSNPQQDHRNLPLDDALNICRRHFEQRLADISSSARAKAIQTPPVVPRARQRDPPVARAISPSKVRVPDTKMEVESLAECAIPTKARVTLTKPPPPFIAQLMEFVCENRPLSVDEYDSLVSYLEKHRNHLQAGDGFSDLEKHSLSEPASKENNNTASVDNSRQTAVPPFDRDVGFSGVTRTETPEPAKPSVLTSIPGLSTSANRVGAQADGAIAETSSRFSQRGTSNRAEPDELHVENIPTGRDRIVPNGSDNGADNVGRFPGNNREELYGDEPGQREYHRAAQNSYQSQSTAGGPGALSDQFREYSSTRDSGSSADFRGDYRHRESVESHVHCSNIAKSSDYDELANFGGSRCNDVQPNERASLPLPAISGQSAEEIPGGRPPILPLPSGVSGKPLNTNFSSAPDQQQHQDHPVRRMPMHESAKASWDGYQSQHQQLRPVRPSYPSGHRPRGSPAFDPNRASGMVRPRSHPPVTHHQRGHRPPFARALLRPVNMRPGYPRGPRPVRY